jgi:hypothetical protein
VAAAVLVLIAVVAASGYLLFGGHSRRGRPPAAGQALLADTGPVDVSPNEGMLVVHALPWAEVLEVRDASGTAVSLPGSAVTPLAIALPEGDYTVRVRHPEVPQARSATAHVVAGRTATVTIEVVSQDPNSFLAKMGW